MFPLRLNVIPQDQAAGGRTQQGGRLSGPAQAGRVGPGDGDGDRVVSRSSG